MDPTKHNILLPAQIAFYDPSMRASMESRVDPFLLLFFFFFFCPDFSVLSALFFLVGYLILRLRFKFGNSTPARLPDYPIHVRFVTQHI